MDSIAQALPVSTAEVGELGLGGDWAASLENKLPASLLLCLR
jgi:hypothetical protein